MEETKAQFKPSLGLVDATMIVAGSMIGSGIFIVSADITRNVGSAGWLIAVWAITGFMTITAAVSYGELSSMYPKAGGQYVYLKEAFNPLAGFLYGWSLFAVIQTATIAAVGVAFSKFAAYLIHPISETNILFQIKLWTNKLGAPIYFSFSAAQLVAIVLIIFLTYTNTKGIKGGKIIQTTFTSAKLLSLFGLIIFGFLLVKNNFWNQNWQTGFDAMQAHVTTGADNTSSWQPIGLNALLGAIAVSMVGSIFSSDAWNNVTFIAGEIKNPQRNIGLSLFLGTLIVTIIYISANLMYLYVLPLNHIAFAQNDRVAIAAANNIFGNAGTYVIAVIIMISTFGCNNGLILAGARVYYTMAKDGLFFRKTATLNKFAVPAYALWIQCAAACLLCLSGKYGDLLTMVSFVVVIFYVLTIIGIFVLRKKKPEMLRPYKAFGYPVLPVIYIILALAFCVGLVYTSPTYSLWGLGITLIGIPLYFIALGNKKQSKNMIEFEKLFSQFSSLKVAVFGDVMLDTYWWGNVERISPEAPVPVVSMRNREQRIGGAGNVALNLVSLGAQTILFTVLGNDDEANILSLLLQKNHINTDYILRNNNRITTNKIRVMGRNQQMLRLDSEVVYDISKEDEEQLLKKFKQYIIAENPDAVIFEDYNKGVLTENLIHAVIKTCKEKNIVTAVDPKRKNFFAYKDADIFKPNLKEVKDGLNILFDDLSLSVLNDIHKQLQQQLHHKISLITLSDKGVFIHDENTSHIVPAHVRHIADVSGAGDTVIAVASLVYAATKDILSAAEIANLAGGIVCEEAGTIAINKLKLMDECYESLINNPNNRFPSIH